MKSKNGKGIAQKKRSIPATKGGSKVRGGYQNKSHPKGVTERKGSKRKK